jgi:pyridoxine 5-phosphate synthase
MAGEIKLSVNINKVALIRNSRGGNLPDVSQVARDCESFGADGITLHPRPDERHARYSDIPALKEVVRTELNVEGNPNERFLKEVLTHIPHQCTLVPDSAMALTSDHGWDTIAHSAFLTKVVAKLKDKGIRVSIFVDPLPDMVEGASKAGADRIELYTGPYAHSYFSDRFNAISAHIEAAKAAKELNLGLNAGHDLNLDNLSYYAHHVPGLLEVSVGHALISDALYFGLANVIGMYKQRLTRSIH